MAYSHSPAQEAPGTEGGGVQRWRGTPEEKVRDHSVQYHCAKKKRLYHFTSHQTPDKRSGGPSW